MFYLICQVKNSGVSSYGSLSKSYLIWTLEIIPNWECFNPKRNSDSSFYFHVTNLLIFVSRTYIYIYREHFKIKIYKGHNLICERYNFISNHHYECQFIVTGSLKSQNFSTATLPVLTFLHICDLSRALKRVHDL